MPAINGTILQAFHWDTPADGTQWNEVLNSTPRKCLAYQTTIEVFAANLGVALEL